MSGDRCLDNSVSMRIDHLGCICVARGGIKNELLWDTFPVIYSCGVSVQAKKPKKTMNLEMTIIIAV